MNTLKKEFKKIHWLSAKNVLLQTMYVIGITIVSTLVLGGFDFLINFIISLF